MSCVSNHRIGLSSHRRSIHLSLSLYSVLRRGYESDIQLKAEGQQELVRYLEEIYRV